ncbi:flagella basal body P-ring formation protein FlgA [Altererythrobacter atlanticus]|uniref:Flagellar basal body P-ring biosynthesis protein FlgA n=1 Tax=Croceibacterium atlanticum TaxID=1267766 RepID=A0A0F7KY91_9SPHN|nr:flagella basal body P-ring formation protein FlgA [Croceibacterium atlanticum]AKH44187.1 flagellar basal body P-ring biosynthesis protein FlgA [Croceibacterium atlanticum]MBB5732498.1 flagella basal body P-ring formation protein FlgA [Croceibacterium atlanticum]
MRIIQLAAGAAALTAASGAIAAGFADPATIDLEVAQFTGARQGEPGGARLPVDRRLKLSNCPQPHDLEWYGRNRETVLVRCPEPGGWRIFVPLVAEPKQQMAAAAPAQPVVSRGESVTIAVRGSGFVLSRQGEAMESGAVGEWIRVRPAGKRTDPVRARVVRPGMVGMDLP